MFACEYEHEAAHTALEQDARHVGQNALAIPRGDASGNEQDPCALRNSPRRAQRLDPRGANRRGVEGGDVDAAWNDGKALVRNLVTRHDRRGGEVRWRDHPVAACECAGPIAAQAGSRHVEQRADHPDRDPRRRHVGDPGPADALRVHDIDPLGGDQTSQNACASPELERIDRGVHERHPLAAARGEFRHQRPFLGCHQGARAGLRQRAGHVERGAGDGFLAQGWHDLQDDRARQGARAHMAVVVAHGGHSLDPRRLVCRSPILVFNGSRRRNTPDANRAPKARFPK